MRSLVAVRRYRPARLFALAAVAVVALYGVSAASSAGSPPTLTVTDTSTYVGGHPAVVVAPNLTLTSGDALNGATVSLTNYVSGQDVLAFTPQSGIGGSFNSATGVLTLSGSATASAYQAALRSVTYRDTSASPTTTPRSVLFSVGTSLANPANGHFYEFVGSPGISWTNAKNAAAARTLYGLQGYLATITSAAENAFVTSKLQGRGWIGGSDAAIAHHWHWVTGPEGLQTGSDGGAGLYFYNQDSHTAISGSYTNWAGGEPNDFFGFQSENSAHFYADGSWNDFPDSSGVDGYVVEYGGMPGDSAPQLTGTATVDVSADAPPDVSVDTANTDNTVYYVDWTAGNPANGTASGVINLPNGSHVSVQFKAFFAGGAPGTLLGVQTGCGTNYWSPTTPYVSAEVPNPPPACDLVQLVGGQNQIYQVTLSEPIRDPIMAVVSLGSGAAPTTYDFDSPFTIVSQGVGFFGGGPNQLQQLPGNVLWGAEGHGTIRFLGTFSTFSWTVPTPEWWHGFTFGIRTTEALAETVSVNEGQTASITGTYSDADGDPVSLSVPVGTLTRTGTSSGTWSWSFPTNDGPSQSQNVTVTANDGAGGSSSAGFHLDVKNVAPTATLANSGPVPIGSPATVSFGGQSDASSADTAAGFHYAFSCSNGDLSGATYAGSGASSSATCTYGHDGTYTVKGRIIDRDGGFGEYTTQVVAKDVTPPVTTASAPSGWVNASATVTLSATDDSSGVAATYYTVDGGPTQTGTSFVLSGDGEHDITYWSVDNAGNVEDPNPLTVMVDRSAPTISASRSIPPNGAGWNKDDVIVSFACADAVSGVASCTAPVSVGEGANQSVTGTAVDYAGNSASATESGINVDETAPSLSGAPTSSPNPAGWYAGPVTIHWSCSDALSGIAGSCPADSLIASEGGDLSVGASVSDRAGNVTTATSPAVSIDTTAPLTTASAPSGWQPAGVTVVLSATDNLSGVAETDWSLDGGPAQTGLSVPIATDGAHTLSFWSVDNAGNTEATRTVEVDVDQTAPTITHTLSPLPNGAGWNNAATTATFACADSLSGIVFCTDPFTFTADGAAQTVTGTATNGSGLSQTDTATVSLDGTPPTITATADRPANAAGWYDAPVTVSFSCGDALSGVAGCASPVTLGEGADQSASGSAYDTAGNAASTSLTGVDVDLTDPTLAPTVSPAKILLFASGTASANAADALSGLASATCGPLDTSTAGTKTVTCTATDKAGNTASATATYTVYSGQSLKQDALARIQALMPGATRQDAHGLADAAAKLAGSLDPRYWSDGIRPAAKGGEHVFDKEKQAADKLDHLISDRKTQLPAAELQAIVAELVQADEIFVQTALADAASGDAKKLRDAQSELAKANDALAKGKDAEGIDHLKNAWSHALEAIKKR